MFTWIYKLATNEFLRGGPCDQAWNPATEGLIVLRRNPSERNERYDGAGGMRQATAQEITDYDAAAMTAQTANQFDADTFVKAVAIWTAGKLSVPLATAKAEILAILRTL